MKSNTELLIRFSRRGQWLVLAIFLFMGIMVIGLTAYPNSSWFTGLRALFPMYPIAVAVAVALQRRGMGHVRIDPSSAAMQAILSDELRQASVNLGLRNAVVAIVIVQPVLGAALTLWPIAQPVALMASLSVVIPSVTLLASMLYYDR
ncbi:MAG: hypothetical protein V4582_15845 [Pseudomonadota bacterium]